MIKVKIKPTIHGVGINDADYKVSRNEIIGGKKKMVWCCPYYTTWRSMLERCYSEKYKARFTTYENSYVSEEWLTFSNFKAWMEAQEWEGLQLDKDILFVGNNIYSSETCVFVAQELNLFLTNNAKNRGDWPIGVHYDKNSGKFIASCSNPFSEIRDSHVGSFDCPWKAHEAWLAKKLEYAYAMAAIQTDTRVAKALIDRYENYKSE